MFDGDGYSEGWHKEAAKRGLAELPTTPDALPWLVEKSTIQVFERYEVLNERELESRFEVAVEQYITKLNIEAEVAYSIAKTMIFPAAVRYLTELKGAGLTAPATELKAKIDDLGKKLKTLEKVNASHPATEGLELAKYMRDKVIPAMNATRAVVDDLEGVVADDLWPLAQVQRDAVHQVAERTRALEPPRACAVPSALRRSAFGVQHLRYLPLDTRSTGVRLLRSASSLPMMGLMASGARRLVVGGLVVLAGLIAAAPAPAAVSPRVVGGGAASTADYPWQVALVKHSVANAFNAQFCGGVIVDALACDHGRALRGHLAGWR